MNEFPLQWSVDTISIPRGSPAAFSYEASPSELEALKQYAEIEDLTSFESQIKATALPAGKFRVSGTLRANLIQSSVVNLEAVHSQIEESFSVEYWPAEDIADAESQMAAFDADPPEPLVQGRVPIGKLLCELFVVAIDPYPRNEDDSFAWDPSHREPGSSPFAELARLRPRKNEGEG